MPRVGQEICIWGIDVVNVNPPLPEPGAVRHRGVPDRARRIDQLRDGDRNDGQLPDARAGVRTAAEAGDANPSADVPAGSGCRVRIAVDAQGNPVAVVVARAAAPSPAVTSVMSLQIRARPMTTECHRAIPS